MSTTVNGQKPTVPPVIVPPADIEAEQSTLGAMLIEAVAVEKATALVGASDFSRHPHQTLFGAIVDMAGRNQPVDFITVQAELKRREALEAIGGESYLLALLDTVPTAANVEHYAKIVADKAKQRRLWEMAHRLAAAAGGEVQDVAALLAQAQSDLERVAQGRAGSKLTRRKPLAARMIDLADVEPPGDISTLFGPYLLPGAAHWLTGQTGIGKSTFVYNLACALAEGTELWGIPCEQTRILYLDTESGDQGRCKKVERLYLDSPRVRGQLFFAQEPILLPAELDALTEFVQAQGINLVIFDTARRCFTVKDENDNAEVYRQIVPVLDALKRLGVASLTMGHPPKNGGFGARGAGAQEDAGDVNLTLTTRGEVSDPNGVITLQVTKNRLLGLGLPPLNLRRVGDDHFERVGAGEMAEEEPAGMTGCASDILVHLETHIEQPARHSEIVKAMREQQHAESTAKRTLSKLLKEGLIVKTEDGRYRPAGPTLE